MALPVILIARTAFALYEVQEATGVIGLDDFLNSIARLIPKLAMRATKHNVDMVAEMVDLAKSRVPVDSGRLLNGIREEKPDDDTIAFVASAVHEDKPNSKEDYARFVEFGTRGGTKGVKAPITSMDGFYSGNVAVITRDRKSLRTHQGTGARPYFFNSASDVLAKYGKDASKIIPEVAAGDGWGVK